MSLPARQQRVIDGIEGALRVSEPHLASMFDVFARLNQDEPVGAEPLAGRQWRPPGHAMFTIILIPVMFAMVVIGAVLSGSTRSPVSCDVGYAVGVGEPSASRPACPATGKKTLSRTSDSGSAACAAAAARAGRARPTTGAAAAAQLTRTGGEQALSPPLRADTATLPASGVC